jgi:LPXTG-motif cell wall-anchored protein
MKKFLLGGFTAAGLLLGGLAITSGGASAAEVTDQNHPACDGTQYVSQPPNSGTSVEAAYTGIMSIKIADNHYSIEVVAGETYGPEDVDGWPTAGPQANPQDISHVDYCVPDEEPPPVEITPSVVYTPPTCESIGTLSFPPSTKYTVTENEDGTFTFVANKGSVFPEGFKATVGPFELAQKAKADCPTDDPPAVVPPAAEPPAAATPQVTVAAAGPVPPAAAPAAAPAPAQALPSTGSSSWGLALTALASLLGGLGLMRLSRRTS